MNDLTAFQRDMLLIIAGLSEPNGQDINDQLQHYYDSEILHGRLYPNLDELVDKKLVNKGQHDLRTNKYELSDYCEQEIKASLNWRLSYIPNDIIDSTTDGSSHSQNN